MRQIFVTSLLAFTLFALAGRITASPHTATIARLEGAAQVLRYPSAGKPVGPAPHVIYEGKHYSMSNAFIGQKIPSGSVVHTDAQGKVRLVYENGDQITVGPSSHFTVRAEAGKKQTFIDLLFGNFRAVIQKDGPRKDTEVRSPSMAMGVRGTDFFVRTASTRQAAQLTVLSGTVAVKVPSPKVGKKAKGTVQELPVPAGFSLEATSSDKAKAAEPVVYQSTKGTLQEVKSVSQVAQPSPAQLAAAAEQIKALEVAPLPGADHEGDRSEGVTTPKDLGDMIAGLERKSREAVLEEIKTVDKSLYAKLAESTDIDVDVIQSAALEHREQAAPEQKKLLKPSELRAPGDDVYKKYDR